MKTFPQVRRVDIDIDFGPGPSKLGGAATANRRILFQYDSEFVRAGLNPSPLRLQLNGELQEGSALLEGLPGLLHDSLPDGWARLVLDRHIRAQGFDPTSLGALDRLALVGADGPGALTYRSGITMPLEPLAVDFDTAAALVAGAPDETDADRIQAALTLTRSLGGARPKAHVFREGDRFTTKGSPDAQSWIVKFPAKNDGLESGAIEYAYSLMAKAAGIDMPATSLLPSNDSAGFFAVERFDRAQTGERFHVHSFGGLLHATCALNALGYPELLRVTGDLTAQSGTNVQSIEEQIRRMAFNVLARNRDDHVKNHAFLMDAKGVWSCAPAFDLTFANLPEHALLVGDEGREPTRAHMLSVARAVRIPDERTVEIFDQVRDAVGDWLKHAKDASVSTSIANDIDGSLNGSGDHELGVTFHFMRSRGSGR